MKLSQSATYAVHAALRLAEEDAAGPVSCGRLAENGHMPERFLLQILRNLAKKGILHSTRGGGGGFMLERDPQDISLLDLIEAVDGPLTTGLPAKMNLPNGCGAAIEDTLNKIAQSTRAQLAAVKLSGLSSPPMEASVVA
jgi:Rrf2 family protein